MRPIENMKEHLIKMSMPEPNTGCWLWIGHQRNKKQQYGAITIKCRANYAHRVSYETFVGKIPDKMDLLHKCDTPSCINPDHLFVGTHADNMRDCLKKGRNPWMLKKSHCIHGHELKDGNFRIKSKNGKKYRQCLACEGR